MRVFVIDASTVGPELQGGLVGVVRSVFPAAAEKKECVETVSKYTADGWAFAGDPRALIGRLAVLTAKTACAVLGFQPGGSARRPSGGFSSFGGFRPRVILTATPKGSGSGREDGIHHRVGSLVLCAGGVRIVGTTRQWFADHEAFDGVKGVPPGGELAEVGAFGGGPCPPGLVDVTLPDSYVEFKMTAAGYYINYARGPSG